MSFRMGVPRAGVLNHRSLRDVIERWAKIGAGRGCARYGRSGGEAGVSARGSIVLGRGDPDRAADAQRMGAPARGEHALAKDDGWRLVP